jgi:hypothetical protein
MAFRSAMFGDPRVFASASRKGGDTYAITSGVGIGLDTYSITR